MKLFFRIGLPLLLVCSLESHSREIVLISFNKHREKAESVKRIIQREIHIPNSLITLQQTKFPCRKNKNAIMHICLNQDAEMHFPQVRKEVIQKALLTFRNSP